LKWVRQPRKSYLGTWPKSCQVPMGCILGCKLAVRHRRLRLGCSSSAATAPGSTAGPAHAPAASPATRVKLRTQSPPRSSVRRRVRRRHTRPKYAGMEPEIVEDKKLAKPCDCGHPAAMHDADGAGRCSAPGCTCRGLPLVEEVDAEDEELSPGRGSPVADTDSAARPASLTPAVASSVSIT